MAADSGAALNAFTDSQYTATANRLDDTYFSGMDRNRWQRTIGVSDRMDQLAKLKLGQGRSEQGWRAGFAQRGMRNSGVYNQAWNNRNQDYATAQGDIWKNWGLHEYGLASEAGQLNKAHNTGRLDTELQRQAQRGVVASSIQA